jgi:outer membrane protein TolC
MTVYRRCSGAPRRTVAALAISASVSFSFFGAAALPRAAAADATSPSQEPTPSPQTPESQARSQQPAPAPQQPIPGLAGQPSGPRTGADATTQALPNPLTLQDAIRAALRLQPDIFASQADRAAAAQRLRQANAAYYPTVSPQFFYGRSYANADGRGAGAEQRNGDISLRYRIYDTGLRDVSARSSRAGLRASEFAEADTRQAVVTDVASSYFTVLRNQALVRVSESQVTRAQNTLDVVTAQVEVGQAAAVDVFQARADLLNAQVNLLNARTNANLAQAQLKFSIGIVGGSTLTLADVPAPTDATPTTATLTPTPAATATGGTGAGATTGTQTPTSPATTGEEATINNYIELAYRTRADVARVAAGIDQNRAAVQAARINSGVLVTSDAAAGYQFAPGTGNNRQINAQVSYPLFDAGATRAAVRAAQANQRAAELQLESLRQQVAVNVEQTYRQVALARASVPAAEAAQRAAQINFEAATESRREGVGDIIDVITAQTLLVQAQTNFVQAVYDFYVADAQLARAVGQAERLVQR